MVNKRFSISAFACFIFSVVFLTTSVPTGESEEMVSQNTDGVIVIIVGEQPEAQNQSIGVEYDAGPSPQSSAEDASEFERGIDEELSPLQKTPSADSPVSSESMQSNDPAGIALLSDDPPVQIDTTYQYDEIGRLISITRQVQ